MKNIPLYFCNNYIVDNHIDFYNIRNKFDSLKIINNQYIDHNLIYKIENIAKKTLISDYMYSVVSRMKLENRDTVGSLDAIQTAVRQNPNVPFYLQRLAYLLNIKNDEHQADSLMAIILCLEPEVINTEQWHLLINGDSSRTLKILTNSLITLEKVYSVDSSAIFAAKIGKLYLLKGNLKVSEAWLRNATARLPNLSRTWYNLALIDRKTQRNDSLYISYLRKSYRLDPNFSAVIDSLNTHYHGKKMRKNAISFINESPYKKNALFELARHKHIFPNHHIPFYAN